MSPPNLPNQKPLWICPICKLDLHQNPEKKSWACDDKHLFDCAKEGYVNLLPPNKKHSSQPGDNADMIAARRRVHSADIYQPLAKAIQSLITNITPLTRILDLGCGEGYYSNALQQAQPNAQVCAIDIAKPAIRLAAKHYSNVSFAVASTFQLPIETNSQDLLIRIFAPASDNEINRVLKPGGHYLEITPAPQHLWALREALYQTPQAHQPARDEIPGLQLQQSNQVTFDLTLNQSLLRDLVAMTPFAHRGHREKREQLLMRESLNLQMAFTLKLFKY